MRTIKFRGQCLGSKKWVYGSLITSDNGAQIHVTHNDLYAVDPEAVGQFTGLLDENDKEIYEGDIMLNPYERHMGFVHFTDAQWFGAGDSLCEALRRHSTVIGNIHDNTELLNFLD